MKLFYQSAGRQSRFFILLYCLFVVSSINAQTISTNSEIYDFQIGDIFQYELIASEPSSGSHVYTNIEIMGKYYSASQDALYYIRSFATHENHSWAPYWVFSKKTDTIFYTNLDSLIHSGNIDTVFTDTVLSGRKVNRWSSYGPSSNELGIFVEGLGQTYYHFVQTSPNTDWENRLIYYKKGSEVWGTPIPLSVSQPTNPLSLLKIFPNPSRGVINLSFEQSPTEDYQLSIYSVSGKLVKQQQLTAFGNEYRVDISSFKAGVYFVRLKSDGELVFSSKFIKQ